MSVCVLVVTPDEGAGGQSMGEFLAIFILLSSVIKMLNLFNPGGGVWRLPLFTFSVSLKRCRIKSKKSFFQRNKMIW